MMKRVLAILVAAVMLSANTGPVLAATESGDSAFFGVGAGHSNSGNYNTFIGGSAGYYNTSGQANTFIGDWAGIDNSTGAYNTFVGHQAGKDNEIGINNTYIGQAAGYYAKGSGNVFIGNGAGFYEAAGSNKLYIDNYYNSGSSPLIYGEFDNRVVQINGSLTMTAVLSPSDARYKKNIEPLKSSLDKVMNLKGVSYDWKSEEYPARGFGKSRQIGLIAQDVETVIPEIIHTDGKGYKSLTYDKLVPVLIEAIKEQQKVIDEKSHMLDAQQATIKMLVDKLEKLDKLEAKLNKLESNNISAKK
jgi:hypothetical protein